jgi:copper resistance protein C
VNPRLLRAFVLACLLVFSVAGIASAHAELVESEPAEGGSIETPGELRATFSIELDPDPARSFIVIRDAAGAEVARGSVTAGDPRTIAVELPQLAPGEYLARWQARDPSDNHTERGTINFTVEAPAATPTPGPATADPATPEPTEETTPAAQTPSPGPSPSPTPDDEPTAGMIDVLMALVLAGVVVGGLALYLLRRR